MPSMNTAHPQPMPSATSTPAAAPKGRQPLMALDDALARLLASITPKMSRIARISTTVSATPMMDLR